MDISGAFEISQMIEDLLSIKLPRGRRSKVLDTKNKLKQRGRLDAKEASGIRKMHSDYSKSIRKLHKAREQARVSMALEKAGLSRADAESIRQRRLHDLKKDERDYGF